LRGNIQVFNCYENVLLKQPPRLSQFDLSRASFEQIGAKFLFQGADRPAERRLSYVHAARCA
jgi:hypothetical protein